MRQLLESSIRANDFAKPVEESSFFDLLRMVFMNMPGYVYWKNKDSIYMGCNYNLAKVSHLNNPAEIIGKKDQDFPWDSFREEIGKIDLKPGRSYNFTWATLTPAYPTVAPGTYGSNDESQDLFWFGGNSFDLADEVERYPENTFKFTVD